MKVENEISFPDADLDNLILPHDDALVITMLVANWELKKILVDNRSSADILYYHAFKQTMIGNDRLKPANSDLFELLGEIVKVTVNEPTEDLISILLYEDNEEKLVRIGSSLGDSVREELIQFLRRNADVFTWTPADMPGIDSEVRVHKLNVDPTCKLIKQKRRHFSPERQQAIKEEVEKLLKADFIQEIKYTDWLANVVMVKKANGKWRIRIDFTDLNKACSKDSYPLPKINQLIDATSGHKLLSFMDAFSG
ncbi:uncharacterized protein LOC143878818 [Tasmannia lanceolata]|uniref:uncharacterized protein LOC143878818 n=1 Tax=Tasmannia lanceolata TaxID=3420 RepID=UPI00406309DC